MNILFFFFVRVSTTNIKEVMAIFVKSQKRVKFDLGDLDLWPWNTKNYRLWYGPKVHIRTKFGDDWVNIFLVIARNSWKNSQIWPWWPWPLTLKHQKLYSLVSGPRVHILTKFGDDWVNIFLVIASRTNTHTNRPTYLAKSKIFAK